MFAALLAGCKTRKDSSAPQATTQTIAPAAAKPAPTSGTDAITQTVDIEDSRSEVEGGGVVANPKATTTATAATSKKKKGKK